MASECEATSSTSSDPNLAAIWSFLELFGEKCALEPISISQLVHMIEDTQEVAAPLKDLHVKLLRRAVKSFSAERWEKCLMKFCHQLGCHQEGWELERFGYKKASWQVKLSVLKKLLEYQFTCNNKFKTLVNQVSSEDLRLNPVGRDRKGRCYWLHTDHRGNLRLYREDYDEETWNLIASDREGLATVIQQLKSGESPTHSVPEPILNEDSNSIEEVESKDTNPEIVAKKSELPNETCDDKSAVKDPDDNTSSNDNLSSTKEECIEKDVVKEDESEMEVESTHEEDKTGKVEETAKEQSTDNLDNTACKISDNEMVENNDILDKSIKKIEVESTPKETEVEKPLNDEIINSNETENGDKTVDNEIAEKQSVECEPESKAVGIIKDNECEEDNKTSENDKEPELENKAVDTKENEETQNQIPEIVESDPDNQITENKMDECKEPESKTADFDENEKIKLQNPTIEDTKDDKCEPDKKTDKDECKHEDEKTDESEKDKECKHEDQTTEITKDAERKIENEPTEIIKDAERKVENEPTEIVKDNESEHENNADKDEKCIVENETTEIKEECKPEDTTVDTKIDGESKSENQAVEITKDKVCEPEIKTLDDSAKENISVEEQNVAVIDNETTNECEIKNEELAAENDTELEKATDDVKTEDVEMKNDVEENRPKDEIAVSENKNVDESLSVNAAEEEKPTEPFLLDNNKINDEKCAEISDINEDDISIPAKKFKEDKGDAMDVEMSEDDKIIEEKVMIITGQGEGAECEGGVCFSEEIEEDVMYVYGEGWGAECCTGNPTVGEAEEPAAVTTNGEDQGQPPAPLPVTKRFLHKSQSDNESLSKVKLWSVDSLCSKPSTSESSNDCESISDQVHTNDPVLQCKDSLKINDSKVVNNSKEIELSENSDKSTNSKSNLEESVPLNLTTSTPSSEKSSNCEKNAATLNSDKNCANKKSKEGKSKSSESSSNCVSKSESSITAVPDKMESNSSEIDGKSNNSNIGKGEKEFSKNDHPKNKNVLDADTSSNNGENVVESNDSLKKKRPAKKSLDFNSEKEESDKTNIKNNHNSATNSKNHEKDTAVSDECGKATDNSSATSEGETSNKKPKVSSKTKETPKENIKIAVGKKKTTKSPIAKKVDKSDTDSNVSGQESKVGKHKAIEDVNVDDAATSEDVSDSHTSEKLIKKLKLTTENSAEEDPLLITVNDKKEEENKLDKANTLPPEEPRRRSLIGPKKIKDLAKAIDAISSRIISDKAVKEKMMLANDPLKGGSGIKSKKIKMDTPLKKVVQKIKKIGDIVIKSIPAKPETKSPKLSIKTKKQPAKGKEINKKSVSPSKVLKCASAKPSESESDEPLNVKRNKRTDSPKGKSDPLQITKKVAKGKSEPIPTIKIITTPSSKKKGKSTPKSTSLDLQEDKPKTPSKNARKRGYQEADSLSEEEYAQIQQSKKFKMKPKKTNATARKKVEERKQLEESSSDEENDMPLMKGKKKPSKTVKSPPASNVKKAVTPASSKSKKASKKTKSKPESEGEDEPIVLKTPKLDEDTPVRQSRRIAQLKIKEEAQRRQLEEVTLRELKAKHKEIKGKDADWKDSESDHSSGEQLYKGKKKKTSKKKSKKLSRKEGWRTSNSDSSDDSEVEDEMEPIDERDHDEEIVLKSDHEFSPESDVEGDLAPVRRARTRKEGGTTSEGCVSCSGNDHPEWILLCDLCDAGWHASCLKPMLFTIPEGDWFCPPCSELKLVDTLVQRLKEYDEKLKIIQKEDLERKEAAAKEPEVKNEQNENGIKSDNSDSDSSSGSTDDEDTSDSGKIYRLRERRQLPISYHFKEYDQLISSAIKEEYKEVDNRGTGNQGRGKDISTIIEADKEEKKALLQATMKSDDKDEEEKAEVAAAIEESVRRIAIKSRKKPRKLNSLEVVSDDADDNSDEDFKETGSWSTSSSEGSDSDSENSKSSHSSDSLPIRRSQRAGIKKVKKKIVDSPEHSKKKSKKMFDDGTTTEASDEKEWLGSKKIKKKSGSRRSTFRPKDKSSRKKKKKKKPKGSDGEEEKPKHPKAKVKYGGLSDSSRESHDWSPAHRTRQKKVNYMEMPNTESEEEMHKPSGKHMDSSDEYKVDTDSDSDSSNTRKKKNTEAEEKVSILKSFMEAPLSKLESVSTAANASIRVSTPIKTENMNPVVKLSDISPIKTPIPSTEDKESIEQTTPDLSSPGDMSPTGKAAKANRGARGGRGRGSRGTYRPRGSSPRGRGGKWAVTHLVGGGIVSPKDGDSLDRSGSMSEDFVDPERERKRKEKEAKLQEKEKKKEERLKKKEEKIQMKEQRAKEREDKKQAKIQDKEQKKLSRQNKPEFMGSPIPVNRPLQFAPGVGPRGPQHMMGQGGPMMRPPFMGQHFPRGPMDHQGEPRLPGMMPGDSPRPHMMGDPRLPMHGEPRMHMPGDPRMSMHGDPRMPMHGDPRMSMLGDPRMSGERRMPVDPRMSMSGDPRMPMPGDSRMPMPGDPRMPMPGDPRMPMSGDPRMPIPGDSRMPMPGDPRMPLPGDSRMPMHGDSRIPLPGDLRMPTPGDPRMSMTGDPRMFGDLRMHMPGDPRMNMNDPRMPGDPRIHMPNDPKAMGIDTRLGGSSPYSGKQLAPGYTLDARGLPVPSGMEMSGPRPSAPKRRGRGPGKKTLARQAAAAGTDGSSPSLSPSMAEGTLAIAGAPQPFRPATEAPSIITRMPHMMPPPYRGGYSGPGSMYGGPRGPHMYRSPHPMDPSPSGGGPIAVGSPQPYYHPRYMGPQDHKEEVKLPEGPATQEIKSEPGTIQIKKSLSPESSPTHEGSAEEDSRSNQSAPSNSPPPSARAHPQLKHTEGKAERSRGRIALTAAARYPQGPYAPQYSPYAPYPPHDMHYQHHMPPHHQGMPPHQRPPYSQYPPPHGMPPQHHGGPPPNTPHNPHGIPQSHHPPMHNPHAPPASNSPHGIHPGQHSHIPPPNQSPHGPPGPHSPHGPPPPHSPHGPPPSHLPPSHSSHGPPPTQSPHGPPPSHLPPSSHGPPPTHSPHGRPGPYGPPHYPPTPYNPHHPSYRPPHPGPYGMPPHLRGPVPSPNNVQPHKPLTPESQGLPIATPLKESPKDSPARALTADDSSPKGNLEPSGDNPNEKTNDNEKTQNPNEQSQDNGASHSATADTPNSSPPVTVKLEQPVEPPQKPPVLPPIHVAPTFPQSPLRHTTPSPHPPASPSPHPRPPSAHHPPPLAHHMSPVHHHPTPHHMIPHQSPYHPHGPPPPLVPHQMEAPPAGRHPDEESGEFGGLVSYFSSQREDDMDS